MLVLIQYVKVIPLFMLLEQVLHTDTQVCQLMLLLNGIK